MRPYRAPQPKVGEISGLGRKDAGRVRSALLAGVSPGRFITIHHFSSLARPAAAASHSTFRHDTPVFACSALFRAPWRLPDPRSIPLQINVIGATPTAREEPSPTPRNSTLFDTSRHFSTLLSNSVESPIPAAAFASCSHLTWGVSSRWERGCSRLALFRKNVFRTPSTTRSVVPKMMRSDYSGECPSPRLRRLVFKMDCALGRGAAEFAVVQAHRDRSCIAEQHPQVKLGAV